MIPARRSEPFMRFFDLYVRRYLGRRFDRVRLWGAPQAPDFARQMQAGVAAAGQWPDGRVLASGVFTDATSCYGYAVGASLFAARHTSQRVPGLDNLILAGKTVFPGPGVANVIRSGLRAADLAEAAAAGVGR